MTTTQIAFTILAAAVGSIWLVAYKTECAARIAVLIGLPIALVTMSLAAPGTMPISIIEVVCTGLCAGADIVQSNVRNVLDKY